MKNWVKRAIRTFIESALGYVAVALPSISFSEDVSAVKSALVGLGVSAFAAGIAAVLNYADDVKGD